MKDVISLLPDSVANQIAAGEVVQRPASVVKELMENAIDAGATKVRVLVVDGGRTSIQVIDNGMGMSETDARLAFERHATSKIKKAEDLFALTTMGFRGEALASISAVAQVELVTRRADDELGTKVVISGSRLEEQEPVAAPIGSNFKIKNLFFNIPARRKFLKSTQTELNNIVTEFERVALVNCGVELSLSHNDTEIIALPASTFRQRICNLFGKKINSQLIEVSVKSTMINISGFVGTPESSRKKGALQYFFANGRYMRHPYFAKAISEAYAQLIPAGDSVPFFLCLDVEPERIDVNIHPTKTEIKFEDEQNIWKIISAAVRESLGRFNAMPGLDFEMGDLPELPEIPIYEGGDAAMVEAPKISYNPDYNPFKSHTSQEYIRHEMPWETLYEGLKPDVPYETGPAKPIDEEPVGASESATAVYASEVGDYQPICQYKGQYILVSVPSGLMWIHQRRAHIRVLYDEYRKQLDEKKGCTQRVLFPEQITLSVAEGLALDGIMDELAYLGFEISSLGGASYAVQGIPAGIDGLNPTSLLCDILHSVMECTSDVGEKLYDRLAIAMARQVAIVPGQILTGEEIQALVSNLFNCKMNARTPDGKSIIYVETDTEIARFFLK
ncbi:MAG: DNA mismatch repair endonuclease MutL [Bacteroidaceae bacterium]|nr:DNA mismatch repair endonuclease MutL [Bacteroidaceae bacterium]